MKNKITNVQGFRDFLPTEKKKRDLVQNIITKTFETSGFVALETPVLEKQELLLGKYGTEADKLIYKFEDNGGRALGLRYDQTVPSARVIAQYQNELPKYFRRYQIQDVFRAEKTQKGRYRQFKQCDIDIYGSISPVSDAEILSTVYFSLVNIGFKNIKFFINDRQILMSTLEKYATDGVNVFSIIQSIDKLDKMSVEDVKKELVSKGLPEDNANGALGDISRAKITEELNTIFAYAKSLGIPEEVLVFNPVLARGLDYYTGMIFEVISEDYKAGSLGGGGRYDNLVEQLVGVPVPAVGFAFGFDRVVEASDELGLLDVLDESSKILVTIMDNLIEESLAVAKIIRESGVATEVYTETQDKLGKQLTYANKNNFNYVVIIGEQEVNEGMITIKEMESGKEVKIQMGQLENYFVNIVQ